MGLSPLLLVLLIGSMNNWLSPDSPEVQTERQTTKSHASDLHDLLEHAPLIDGVVYQTENADLARAIRARGKRAEAFAPLDSDTDTAYEPIRLEEQTKGKRQTRIVRHPLWSLTAHTDQKQTTPEIALTRYERPQKLSLVSRSSIAFKEMFDEPLVTADTDADDLDEDTMRHSERAVQTPSSIASVAPTQDPLPEVVLETVEITQSSKNNNANEPNETATTSDHMVEAVEPRIEVAATVGKPKEGDMPSITVTQSPCLLLDAWTLRRAVEKWLKCKGLQNTWFLRPPTPSQPRDYALPEVVHLPPDLRIEQFARLLRDKYMLELVQAP